MGFRPGKVTESFIFSFQRRNIIRRTSFLTYSHSKNFEGLEWEFKIRNQICFYFSRNFLARILLENFVENTSRKMTLQIDCDLETMAEGMNSSILKI